MRKVVYTGMVINKLVANTMQRSQYGFTQILQRSLIKIGSRIEIQHGEAGLKLYYRHITKFAYRAISTIVQKYDSLDNVKNTMVNVFPAICNNTKHKNGDIFLREVGADKYHILDDASGRTDRLLFFKWFSDDYGVVIFNCELFIITKVKKCTTGWICKLERFNDGMQKTQLKYGNKIIEDLSYILLNICLEIYKHASLGKYQFYHCNDEWVKDCLAFDDMIREVCNIY